jgi:hypothetical protein
MADQEEIQPYIIQPNLEVDASVSAPIVDSIAPAEPEIDPIAESDDQDAAAAYMAERASANEPPPLEDSQPTRELRNADKDTSDWAANYNSEANQTWIDNAVDVAGDIAADVGKGIVVEGATSIIKGVTSGASEIIQSVDDLAWWLDENVASLQFELGDLDAADKNAFQWLSRNLDELQAGIGEANTNTGQIIKTVSQFLASGGAVGKLSKALGMPKGKLKSIFDTFAGSAVGFDPRDERLSNMIDEMAPNAFTEFLKADEEDPVVVARIKSGVEGALADGLLIGMRAIKNWYKSSGAAKVSPDLPTPATADEAAAEVAAAAEVVATPAVIRVSNDNTKFAEEARKYLTGEVEDVPVKVNVDRFDGPEHIKNEIAKLSQLLPEDEVISMKTTMDQAKALQLEVDDLTGEIKGTLFDRRQIAAAWMMFRSSADQLVSLAERARSTGAPEDVAKFNAAFQVTHAILRTTKGQSTEIARALQIHNQLRKADKNMAKALQGIIDETGGANVSIDLADKIASLRDPAAIAKFADEVAKSKSSDGVLFAYANVLMSNPATQVVNIVDTTISSLWRVPETWMAAKIGDNVADGESMALAYGMTQGIVDGIRYAYRTLKTGQEQFAPTNPIEIPGKQGVIANDLGAVNDNKRMADYLKMMLPTNLSRAGDQLLKVINYRGSLNQLAYRDAVITKGLSGAEAREHVAKLTRDVPDWLNKQAESDAIAATFNEKLENKVAQGFSTAVNGMSVGPIPFGRILLATFVRTPINLFRWTVQRTPAAFLSSKIREDIAAGGAQRDMALGRIAAGTAFAGSFANYVMQGKISGAGPKDPKLRAAMREATGWQPYSIQYAPGKWVSYNRFATLGSLIGISADATELLTGVYGRETERVDLDGIPVEESAMAAVVVPFANAVLSKVYMQQLSSLVDALSDPNRYGESYFQRLASSFVPAVVGATERAMDPDVRRATDWMEAIQARVPGLSEGLEQRLNLWGEVRQDQNGIYNLFLPARISVSKESPIDKEFVKLGYVPSDVRSSMSFSSGGLTADISLIEGGDVTLHNDLIKLSGNGIKIMRPGVKDKMGLKDYLNAVVTGKAGRVSMLYNERLGNEDKIEFLRGRFREERNMAKEILIKDNPKLEQRIRLRLKELAKNRIDGRPGAQQAPALPQPSQAGQPTLRGIR